MKPRSNKVKVYTRGYTCTCLVRNISYSYRSVDPNTMVYTVIFIEITID